LVEFGGLDCNRVAIVTASEGPVGEAAQFGIGLSSSRALRRHARRNRSGRATFSRYRRGLAITDNAEAWALGAVVPFAGHSPAQGFPFALLTAALISIFLLANRTRSKQVVGAGGREFARVIVASLFAFGIIAIVVLLLDLSELRRMFLLAMPAETVTLLLGRAAWREWLSRQKAHGRSLSRAVIVGRGVDVAALTARIETSPETEYVVVGAVVDDLDSVGAVLERKDLQLSVGWDTIVTSVQSTSADIVIVTGAQSTEPLFVRDLSWSLEATTASLALAASLSDVAVPRIRVQSVDGMPLIHVEAPTFSGTKHLIKRSFDIAFSACALVLLFPLLIVIAFAIKLDSEGPVIFYQQRVGKNGRHFTMLKFRSMVETAEEQLSALLEMNEGASGLFKLKRDPRVTRVGAILRKYSLDELPQLWNILIGDMSMVGPRPPLQREVSLYEAHMNRRLYIKPGLTGLWQVSGRSDLSWERSIHLDLYYVANWSLAGDLIVMWRTVKVVFKSQGAY
jgi:exopolysaccharide biosynthesis polyprenyl glycosylphosphotransferase